MLVLIRRRGGEWVADRWKRRNSLRGLQVSSSSSTHGRRNIDGWLLLYAT